MLSYAICFGFFWGFYRRKIINLVDYLVGITLVYTSNIFIVRKIIYNILILLIIIPFRLILKRYECFFENATVFFRLVETNYLASILSLLRCRALYSYYF